MNRKLNILMTVPVYKKRTDKSWNNWYNVIAEKIEKKNIDLVVFPEMFISGNYCEGDNDIDTSKSILSLLKGANFPCAILAGFSNYNPNYKIDDKHQYGQWAVYYNPNAKKGETEVKYYAKHSSFPVIAYEIPDYGTKWQKEFFTPIILNDYKIQVSLCHDSFFPLVTEKLEQNGMDMMINLTGWNVVKSKWHNVYMGKSCETNKLFLCTT